MKKVILNSALILCVTSATAQTQAPAAEPSIAPAASSTSAPLTFLDSKLFDNMLSKELSSEKELIEVTIAGKISLNNIPARIDKWITLVGENGEVTLTPSEPALKPKFVLGLLPMIPLVYSYIKKNSEERSMEAAKKYNASVVYLIDKSGESTIEKIVFIRKK